MSYEVYTALHTELRTLGQKMVQGIQLGRDYSEFEARFNAIDTLLSSYTAWRSWA